MYQYAQYAEALLVVWTLYKVWIWERNDWYKLEDLRKELLGGETMTSSDMLRMAHLTERCRRVTWRMGVCGAFLLALLLCLCRVVPWDSFVAAALPGWVIITSVLNFRAYHLEDEQTQVLFSFLNAK